MEISSIAFIPDIAPGASGQLRAESSLHQFNTMFFSLFLQASNVLGSGMTGDGWEASIRSDLLLRALARELAFQHERAIGGVLLNGLENVGASQ